VAEVAEQLGIEVVAFATDLYGVDPVEGIDAAVSALGSLGPGDAVLIKASRSVALERLVAAIS
jgi:UDP-N-acetylmuramoyl-tripeptide--D-alanyl-D-alanine ligase